MLNSRLEGSTGMTSTDFLFIGAAVFAILMTGSGHLRLNLFLYSLQTICIALATIANAQSTGEQLYLSAVAIIVIKAIAVPYFLVWVIRKIDAGNDPGAMLPIPMSMHTAIIFLALSHFLAQSLPRPAELFTVLPPGMTTALPAGAAGPTAAISLLLTGILFMLTRRVALSQIIGFLTMENGIYLFAITETRGMPMLVEMGVLLDVLVAVMIAGLITFRIKKSFEHIDVTQLTALKES